MKKRYTPEIVTELADNEVFVFGSTRKGKHLGGAARMAVKRFGAIMGNGFGPQGQSYAIPTIVGDISKMVSYVSDFIQYAKSNPNIQFLVTKIGCGRAKFSEEQVAPLFRDAYSVENIVLPESFCRIIETTLPAELIQSSELDEQSPIEPTIDEKPKVGIKVIGKIDLSQFETAKQKSVRSLDKENIYIIDTNVFVEDPNIISKIHKQYRVALSAKVVDELDRLKITLDEKAKRNVEKALRHINQAMDRRSNLSLELADLTLLPADFSKKSPDNIILSVALKFNTANPIILTSDNGLQVKAKGLGIATISLIDFLKKK